MWVRLAELQIPRDGLTKASVGLLAATFISLPWAFYYSGAAVGAQSVMRWTLLAAGFLLLAWIAYGPTESPQLLRLILAAALFTSIFAVVDFLLQLPRTVRFSEQYIYGGRGPLRRAQSVLYDARALRNFRALILTLLLAPGLRARQARQVPPRLGSIRPPALSLAPPP